QNRRTQQQSVWGFRKEPTPGLLTELAVQPDPGNVGVERFDKPVRTLLETRCIVEEDEIQLRKRLRYRFILHRPEYDRRKALVERGCKRNLFLRNGAGPYRIRTEHENDRVRPCDH